MEGTPNDGTSADPPMTPIERQMQVIATSVQDLAQETTRQNANGLPPHLWNSVASHPWTPQSINFSCKYRTILHFDGQVKYVQILTADLKICIADSTGITNTSRKTV